MDNDIRTEAELQRETIQLEREQIREKIRELIETEYARLEEEASRIAPEFDYEAEAEKLKAEEEEELAKVAFAWADVAPEKAEKGSVPGPEPSADEAEPGDVEPELKAEKAKKEIGRAHV